MTEEKQPLVSIIVAVYNAEQYLIRCLNSISTQTYLNWECLLIDDGSTDSSGTICDGYAKEDLRFKVWHCLNGGVASARKRGTEFAKGKFSIHIDSDDWVEPNMINEMVSVMERNSCDMLISDYYLEREKKSFVVKQRFDSSDSNSLITYLLKGQIQGFLWNKMIRHSLYREFNIQYIPNFNYGEDMLICIQLLQHNLKVIYFPNAYYHYTINKNSITNSYSEQTFSMRKEYIHILDNILPIQFANMLYDAAYKVKLEGLYAGVLTKKDFYGFYPSGLNQILSVKRPDVLPFSLFAYLGAYDIGLTIYEIIHNIGKRINRLRSNL